MNETVNSVAALLTVVGRIMLLMYARVDVAIVCVTFARCESAANNHPAPVVCFVNTGNDLTVIVFVFGAQNVNNLVTATVDVTLKLYGGR